MRIPRSKLYRAFPELDRFDDDQCKLLMRRVDLELAAWSAIWLLAAAAAVGAEVLVVLGWSIVGLDWAAAMVRDGDLAVGAISGLAVPAAAALLVRDAALGRFLVRAIRLRIDRVRCLACKYVLIGQRPDEGGVTCPECGTRNLLVELGVSEADLVPPTSDLDV